MKQKRLHTPRPTPHARGGFSLVELIVVVGIFTLLTSIALANHGQFGSRILLGNLAYDIALSIREAQTYGLSVRGFETGTGTLFDIPYGAHFESSNQTGYTLFADRNGNQLYDTSQNETVEVFRIQRGRFIKEYCVKNTGPWASAPCSTPGDGTFLAIMFERPDPSAVIRSNVSGTTNTYAQARITVASPQGFERSVQVALSGQISVKQP